jgi:hypothetical protein
MVSIPVIDIGPLLEDGPKDIGARESEDPGRDAADAPSPSR